MSGGLIGAITSGFGARPRSAEVDITALLAKHYGMASKAGPNITVDNALSVTTVLACTRALAEGVSQIPIKLIQEDEKGQKRIAREHPVHRVMAFKPNPWMSSFGFRETMMYHAALTGDAVAVRVDVRKNLRELIPVAPENLRIKRNSDHSLTYDILDQAGNRFLTLGESQVFHLRGPSWNSYSGLNVIRLARDAIGLAIATEENHAFLHKNGSRVGGILTTEKSLQDDDIKRIRALWEAKTTGPEGAYGTRIIDSGLTYQPMGMKGVDAEHLATREHQIQEICRAMNVFPMVVGYADKTATFASAEAFFTAHVVLSLGPWFQRWQDAVNTQLLTESEVLEQGYSAKLFPNGLLRGDHRARAAFYQVMVLTGIFTRNECRVFEDMNPLEGLDDPLVPLNMGNAGDPPPDENGQKAPALPNAGILPKSILDGMKNMLMGHNGGPSLRENVGKILSAENESLIRGARNDLTTVLDKVEPVPGE